MDNPFDTPHIRSPLDGLLQGDGEPIDEFVRLTHGVVASVLVLLHPMKEQHARWADDFTRGAIGITACRDGTTTTIVSPMFVYGSDFKRFTPAADDLWRVIMEQHLCQVDAAFDLYLALVVAATRHPGRPPAQRLTDAVVKEAKDLLSRKVEGTYARLQHLLGWTDKLEGKAVFDVFQRYRDTRNLLLHGGGIVNESFKRLYPDTADVGERIVIDLATVHDVLNFVRMRVYRIEARRRRMPLPPDYTVSRPPDR